MEDYKEKYENALAKIKQIFDKGSKFVIRREVFESIFPELKESEDEKIRKALIKYCKLQQKANNIGFCGISLIDAIAWLEKQKSVREIVERCKNSWYNEGKIAGMAEGLTDDEKYQQGWHDALEKQGKQKPVLDFKASNWYVSKVDGKIHDMTYNPADKVEPRFKVKYAGSEYNVLEVKDIAGVTFYEIEDEPNHIDYVKVENCEIISGYAIKENGSPYPTKSAVFSEQKPAWSEEDEEIHRKCICAMRASACGFPEEEKFVEQVDNWLKSLKERYTWKPSDEQMFDLKCAADSNTNVLLGQSLLSLYNDLKKLREE